jgi:cytochrome c553
MLQWRTEDHPAPPLADKAQHALAGAHAQMNDLMITLTTARLRAGTRAALCAAVLMACGVASAAPANIPDTLAQRLQACTACHGKDGQAAPDGYRPRIAGKPAGYLYHQLLNFRDGRRHYGPMVAMVEPLQPAYLREIAEHFAALDLPYPAPAPVQADAAQLQRGRQLALQGDAGRKLPACTACHGQALTGTLPATPGLLGLPRDYLMGQLGAWHTGQRRAITPDCMAEIVTRLAPGDIGAVSAWLASQPVPAVHHKPQPPSGDTPPLRCGSVVVDALVVPPTAPPGVARAAAPAEVPAVPPALAPALAPARAPTIAPTAAPAGSAATAPGAAR